MAKNAVEEIARTQLEIKRTAAYTSGIHYGEQSKLIHLWTFYLCFREEPRGDGGKALWPDVSLGGSSQQVAKACLRRTLKDNQMKLAIRSVEMSSLLLSPSSTSSSSKKETSDH